MARAFSVEGIEITHLLVVRDAERSRDFYRDVLGAELYREYGGTSVVMRFLGTWLLLVTGGANSSLRRCSTTGRSGPSSGTPTDTCWRSARPSRRDTRSV